MTAATTAVEIVSFEPESIRAQHWLTALEQGAKRQGLDVYRTSKPASLAPWLLLWGPGAPARAAAMRTHVAAGGRAVAWDLAYWDRERKARVSFDAAHPQAYVMRRDLPAYRFAADRVPVADLWNPKGPIIIAGLGEKARVQYGGAAVDRWEEGMFAACRAQWPTRPVIYRKKKAQSPHPGWASTVTSGDGPIDKALAGRSLVITWHSNVAVDAIRMGIPVVCRDGAAAAVCPSELSADPQPLDAATRDRFLANLAWFQWAPNEVEAFWTFAQETLQ
jgi:hypothetical protein